MCSSPVFVSFHVFRKKEEQLKAKDLQLQHQIIRFNKFLQDNEAKRRRAEARAAEEMEQIRLKVRLIFLRKNLQIREA